MNEIPDTLLSGPFTNAQAAALDVPAHMLTGRRFVRIHPRVWRHRDHVMTPDDDVQAARLAMPDDACLTGITRLQALGLEFGPRSPIRFVVARDHHIDLDGIFLHRTRLMPPHDDAGVCVAAAFISYCSLARALDAIKVGDWLLRHDHLDLDDVRTLALAQTWRAGAPEALWLLEHLDGRSRSLTESETRSFLTFAGLPAPEPNALVRLDDARVVAGDLVYRSLGLFVEYEGSHHQEDRRQYVADIDRYASLRHSALDYVQVTKEKMRRPRALVLEVHERMRTRGYDGPPPRFGEHWRLLLLPMSVAVGPRPLVERAVTG